MRYLQISAGPWTDEPLPFWARALNKLSPANSDLDKFYPKIYKWWLEIENDGTPKREIGFDENMNPIVIGPVGENYGMLVDCCEDWSDSKEDSEEAAKGFESIWAAIWPKFSALDK